MKSEPEKHIDVYKAATETTFTKEKLEEAIRYYAVISGCSAERIGKALKNLCATMTESMERVANILHCVEKDIEIKPVEDIPYLKRQIKHCKNPLEEKALRKRLNSALKKAKGEK